MTGEEKRKKSFLMQSNQKIFLSTRRARKYLIGIQNKCLLRIPEYQHERE